MRFLALVGVAVGVVSMLAIEAAHDTGRVDEAGVVLVGVCVLGMLFVCYHLWRGGGTQIALTRLALPGGDVLDRPVPAAAPAAGPVADVDQREAAIQLDSITVRFDLRVAVEGLSLRVHKGEIVGLLGPNGAGKTTTVDVCCGLRRPEAGRATILGYDAVASGAELRRRIGVVPQESGLYPELTGAEHMELFAALYDVRPSGPRIEELLTLFGLWERRKSRVSAYSGGMKRRLALARALLHDPPVLFLDEPSLGVDVHGRRALWDHVSRLRDEGRSVLLTTNYLEEATALCDRVVIIDHGKVLADERPETLRRQSGTTLVLEVEGEREAVARAIREACAVDASTTEDTVRVPLPRDDLAAVAVETASRVTRVTAVRTEEPSLEEVFLRLTGRGLRE